MSQIKQIPDLDWSDHAKREIVISGQALLDETDFAWVVGKVAMCGLIYRTFTSPPWFWFALANGVTFRDLIDFRRLARLIPQGAQTAIEADYATGIRFATFYGFEDTGEVQVHRGAAYKIFRRS